MNPDPALRTARSILSDQPASEDQLNFAPYAKTLADIVADPATATPLTIGVFGSWGQGKTSLMRMVERRVVEQSAPGFPVQPVWFNAWLYSQQQSLWRALISRVLNAAHKFATLNDDARRTLNHLEARLYGATNATVGQLALPGAALRGLNGVTLPPLMGLELMRRQASREGDEAAEQHLQQLIADVEESEAHTRRDQIAALDDFRREFERISQECIVDHGRLAVFVDDLDRCLPDKAVEVLEAIKLFLDVPGVIFVLGIARDVIEQGIKVRYKDYETQLNGAEYLEKIIQIPFSLPPIDESAIKGYVHRLAGTNLPDPRCETVFSVGLEPNPRRLKRTLNIFLLLWRLTENREDLRDVIKPVRLAKIVIIQQYHPKLFDLLQQGPHYLSDLEQRFRAPTPTASKQTDYQGQLTVLNNEINGSFSLDEIRTLCFDLGLDYDNLPGDTKSRKVLELVRYFETAQRLLDLVRYCKQQRSNRSWPDETSLVSPQEQIISAGPLQEFLDINLLRMLLTCTDAKQPDANFIDLNTGQVREYIYLTHSTVEEAAPSVVTEKALPFEPQLVTIPAGKFLMGASDQELNELQKLSSDKSYLEHIKNELPQHEVNLPTYAIGRYPVTNAEFGRFIEDGGYTTQAYWTEAGWKQKDGDSWTQPRYWADKQGNDPSQPVVGVSWYEAHAYCQWLAKKTGKPYRLPTEAEWEHAARGSEGYRYPWGNQWDKTQCNNKENGAGQTTPVGQFSPQGDSSFGVGDLTGQVWEWCSTKFASYPYKQEDGREASEGDDTRIQKGGSWADDMAYCRCGYRLGGLPGFGVGDYGFRCARSL